MVDLLFPGIRLGRNYGVEFSPGICAAAFLPLAGMAQRALGIDYQNVARQFSLAPASIGFPSVGSDVLWRLALRGFGVDGYAGSVKHFALGENDSCSHAGYLGGCLSGILGSLGFRSAMAGMGSKRLAD